MESDLFDQIARLLSAALAEKGEVPSSFPSELVCCTQALHTTLYQHLAKEEEQVSSSSNLYLIVHHVGDFSKYVQEQRGCSIET